MLYTVRFSYATAVFAAVLFLLPNISFAAEVAITITDSTFSPKNVTINPGDTIKWVNASNMAHTATSDNGSFDSGTIISGQTFAAMFNASGSYQYHCNFHGGAGGTGMAGTITVASTVAPSITNTQITNSPSNAQLQAQAQALINQLATLQAQARTGAGVGTVSGGTGVVLDPSPCPRVGRSLKRGASGEDVTRLSNFLRETSIYPEMTVSGYCGAY